MFSRRASSSIRARTGSRGGRRLSRNACSSSGTRTVFMSRRLRAAVSTWRDRLPGAHAFTAIRQDDLVELRGRQGLVKLRQASVQWLELRARQASLDLHHALAGVVEGSLVGAGPALEVQADLEAPGAGVMPDLEMELWVAVMELGQTAVAPARLKRAQLLRQL